MPLHEDSENGRVVTIGKHSRLNRQIWYRHPNSEAGNDEIQNFQREDFILWELHSKILVGDKNLLLGQNPCLLLNLKKTHFIFRYISIFFKLVKLNIRQVITGSNRTFYSQL
jgi:hypothetical protein